MSTPRILAPFALILALSAPAMAGSFGGFLDLPHLSFPPTAPAPVTQGTGQPLAVVPGN